MAIATRQHRPLSRRNVTFAAIFVGFSVAVGIYAYETLKIGTAAEMGAGFFPVMLSIVLGFLSLAVAFTPIPQGAQPLRFAPVKASILIMGSPLIFAASIQSLGLVAAVALTIFFSSFASRFATLRQSLLLSVGFTVFCVAVFHYLLNLPIALWGDLITG
ncbi:MULTISPECIES: tripartite tricarboxylate transporter TctB family protein [unclassified Neorhizobium]|uniref:tripartite tricarboxylate transporter TctB family protein n=1 Tax=unclassified Neorhizobium TaxID=2629175 RepID=UPI001FF1C8C6|nr:MULTISPECIES: tripartite tricarboxylate transporter TctB family protein [unclassified Neorhizobium]MCJ9672526.1 tripartite tricarboxylate transporter TctB family protein [Neorhizobium sp. SHOUNA12B]MCJ9746978.1 tripartite tricarboxylate transporter TctB family protein [Neorhizobium sp. SHOUNA12A]